MAGFKGGFGEGSDQKPVRQEMGIGNLGRDIAHAVKTRKSPEEAAIELRKNAIQDKGLDVGVMVYRNSDKSIAWKIRVIYPNGILGFRRRGILEAEDPRNVEEASIEDGID